MTPRFLRAVVLAAGLLPAARAQFQLFAIEGGTEKPVLSLYDLGAVNAGEPLSASFRLRNGGGAPAYLTLLSVAGTGFSLHAGISLPAAVAPQGAVDFTVDFQAADPGGYSAVFRSDGVSVFLTVTVAPSLTYAVDLGGVKLVLGGFTVDFGTAETGQSTVLHFAIGNLTGTALTVPPVRVSGPDFSLAGANPSGAAVPPGQSSGFDIQFRPVLAGTRNGLLTIGSRTFPVAGTGIAPPLPRPQLQVDWSKPQSGQQASVKVMLDAPARAGGSGTVTLEFQPAPAGAKDPAIAFASGARTAQFVFAPGDSQARFGDQAAIGFQTGTTAGNLILTAQLGSAVDRQSFAVAAAPVVFSSSQATRSDGRIDVQIAGFDNTRTAGPISFTFFDLGGNVIGPGAILVDGSSAFQSFFPASDVGGSFLLRALFPVTGDISRVASFQAAFTNSAGTAATARITF